MTREGTATKTNGGRVAIDEPALPGGSKGLGLTRAIRIATARRRSGVDVVTLGTLVNMNIKETVANREKIEEIWEKLAKLEAVITVRIPKVEYVEPSRKVSEQTAPPALFQKFYGLSLTLTLVFGGFLLLEGIGVRIMHPFLAAVGLLGSLGWLTTAATDLRDWRTSIGNRTT